MLVTKKLQNNTHLALAQGMNKPKSFVKHISCDCRFRLDGKECKVKDGTVTIERHV